MNAQRLLARLLSRFLPRLMNAPTRSKSRDQMSPDERKQAKAARQTTRAARKAMQVTRRMGRF